MKKQVSISFASSFLEHSWVRLAQWGVREKKEEERNKKMHQKQTLTKKVIRVSRFPQEFQRAPKVLNGVYNTVIVPRKTFWVFGAFRENFVAICN